jgi:hypothetical protein
MVTLFGTALLGGIAGGVIVRRIPNLVENAKVNTALKAAIGVGATYFVVKNLKSSIGAAGFAAGYGSELVKELNIPGLSEELMQADFVDPTTLSELEETLVLDDNGDLVPMSELMEEEFAEFDLMNDDDDMSELEEETMMMEDLEEDDLEEDELSGRRRGRLKRLIQQAPGTFRRVAQMTPQAQALKYIYPRAFK